MKTKKIPVWNISIDMINGKTYNTTVVGVGEDEEEIRRIMESRRGYWLDGRVWINPQYVVTMKSELVKDVPVDNNL